MKGYQVTFYTQQDRQHEGIPLANWLMNEAHKQGINGTTIIAGVEGMGRDGKLHSTHFFELADQPIAVTMALGEQQAEDLLTHIKQFKLRVFYVKTPMEYGILGED